MAARAILLGRRANMGVILQGGNVEMCVALASGITSVMPW